MTSSSANLSMETADSETESLSASNSSTLYASVIVTDSWLANVWTNETLVRGV